MNRKQELARVLDSLMLEIHRITRRKLYVRHPQQALERWRAAENVFCEGLAQAAELQVLIHEDRKANKEEPIA